MILADVKRFNERWRADRRFRKAMPQNPVRVCREYGLQVDPQIVQPIWDQNLSGLWQDQKELARRYPDLALYQKQAVSEQDWEAQNRAGRSSNAAFAAWRERQIARNQYEFPRQQVRRMLHLTAAFELSLGCSVGCWFCSLEAEPLSAVFEFSPANAELWRQVLETMAQVLGPAAGSGMCYWATEPLDNPDYERFCSEFHHIMGIFPRTTTARALDNPSRTRGLLSLSAQADCKYNRFSLLSLKDLERVHAEFRPAELAEVTLVGRFKGSLYPVLKSGRARRVGAQSPDWLQENGTNICICGFVVNMVERSVRLITPCPPGPQAPMGLVTLERVGFTGAAELKEHLLGMIQRHMPLEIPADWPLAFVPGLDYAETPEGFELFTPSKKQRLNGGGQMRELGRMIKAGKHTAGQAVDSFDFFSLANAQTVKSLNLIYQQGVLAQPGWPDME